MLQTPQSSPGGPKSSPHRPATTRHLEGQVFLETTNASTSLTPTTRRLGLGQSHAKIFPPTPPLSSPVTGAADHESDGPAKKRRRVEGAADVVRDVFHADDEEMRHLRAEDDSKREVDMPVPVRMASASARRAMTLRMPRFASSSARRFVPQDQPNPLLASFVSCAKTDLYKMHTPDFEPGSIMDTGDHPPYCLPFIGSYSHGAKAGRNHLLAIATQEGTIEIVDARPRHLFDPDPQRTTIVAHANAVFDVKWSTDDTRIATSAGDHSSAIYDVETNQRLATFHEHKLSVKTTLWNPCNPDLLVSCSRDGDVHGWDLRERRNGRPEFKPIFSIPQAHQDGTGRSKPKRSVTSINYLPNREHLLLSSGSADGILKTWDVRCSRRRLLARGIVKSHFDASRDLTALRGADGDVYTGNSRAIVDVVVHPTGSVAFGIGKNGSLYTYHLDDLGWFNSGASPDLPYVPDSSSASPSKSSTGDLSNLSAYLSPIYSNPALKLDSFYPRIALSPCGSYLAAGSTTGNILLWDVDKILSPVSTPAQREAVVLGGPRGETSGVDWGYDSLVSCSDDLAVRVWRRNPVQARECREEERRDGHQAFGAWGYPVLKSSF